MTRQELITTLQTKGIDRVYGRALSRCLKQELEATYHRLTENTPSPYLSFQQINMYLRCGLQYYLRYVEGIKIPPKAIISLGQSFHQTTRFNYTDKIKTGQDKALSELTDYFVEDFFNRKSQTIWQEDEKPDDFIKEGVSLITLAREQRFPEVQPKEVEHEFIIPFENVDYSLMGFIDLIDQYGIIRDNKTSSKSYTEEQVKTDMQLTCYAYANNVNNPQLTQRVGFDIFVKTKTPKIQVLEGTRSYQDYKRFLTIVGIVADGIFKNVFLPASLGHWACSPDWCGYWDRCHQELS
ncbi:MAG: PD-(D/E)XK nuclease family protein [Candidatus Omnitrophota bacterium]